VKKAQAERFLDRLQKWGHGSASISPAGGRHWALEWEDSRHDLACRLIDYVDALRLVRYLEQFDSVDAENAKLAIAEVE